MNKKIRLLIQHALLTLSARDIMDEIDIKTLHAPNLTKRSNENTKHFRELEKRHSKKNKKLYNQGY